MRALVLASLLFSLPAFAGTSLDKFDARAALVNVTSTSEVPLYRVGDDDRLFVRARVAKDREALFVVSLAGSSYEISEDLAKELKLKVKSANKRPLNVAGEDGKFKEGGEIKLARLATLDLGTLHIEGLQVTVNGKLGQVGGHAIEGVIGLAAFDNQLAWALLNSKGVLQVGPSASGAAMVSAVGGQPLAYENVARTRFKDKLRGEKFEGTTARLDFIVPATLGAQAVKLTLDNHRGSCTVSPALALPAGPQRAQGDRDLRWLGLSLGGVEIDPTWYAADGAFTVQIGPELPHQATLCPGAMRELDLAIDPVARKIAVAKADNKRPDVSETLLAELKARAEKPPAAEPDKKDDNDAGPKKPSAKPWKALYSAQFASGAYLDAAASAKKLTEIDPRDCSAWQSLGAAQAGSGLFTDAIASYTKSSALYHAWWDISLEEREKLEKSLGKLKTDAEKDAAEHKVQPGSCFTADGDLALAALATGDYAAVDKLYQERLDLDPDVALAAGNAALRQGRWEQAAGPYRQAIKRETVGKPDLVARQGVALAALKADNWDAARPAFEGVFSRGGIDLLQAMGYLDGVRAERGQEASLLVARSLAEGRPDLLVTQVLWFEEATRSGDADAIARAKAAVEQVAYTPLTTSETRTDRVALYAWYLATAGNMDEASKIAREGIDQRPDLALAWLTLARVAESAGDSATAAELKAKAIGFGARYPAFALLASAASE